MLMVFFADSWWLRSSLPQARDIDQCLVVNCLILGRFAKVIFAKAATQNAIVGLSKLQNKPLILFYLICPDSFFPCWGTLALTMSLSN